MAVGVPALNQFLAPLMIPSLTRTVVMPHRIVPVSNQFIILAVTFLPFSHDISLYVSKKIDYMNVCAYACIHASSFYKSIFTETQHVPESASCTTCSTLLSENKALKDQVAQLYSETLSLKRKLSDVNDLAIMSEEKLAFYMGKPRLQYFTENT